MAVSSGLIISIYGYYLLRIPYGLIWGDADFFFANGEAFRRTVLEFHQFPWWNPWIAGGIPLYADPQFGLFSIQALLILLFGPVVGWKLAIIGYLLIGHFGFVALARKVFKAPDLTAVLISLTWSFAWLWSSRAAGHFTFFTLAFLPWALYFFWARKRISYPAIKFGLICALAINAAPHNTTIMLLFISALAILFDVIASKLKNIKEVAKFVFLAGAVALPLSIHKLASTYIYSKGSTVIRTTDLEEFPGLKNIFKSLFGIKIEPGLLPAGWGKSEALVGVGLGVFIILFAILVLAINRVYREKNIKRALNKSFNGPYLFCILMVCIALSLSLGDFHSFSPYTILRDLPVFDKTRVAVRWLIVAGFFSLVIISAYNATKKQRTIINGILSINIIYLIFIILTYMSGQLVFLRNENPNSLKSGPPQQISNWSPHWKPYVADDEALYLATKSNVDQINTGLVPFFSTKHGGTDRCDESQQDSCAYVKSRNAVVEKWTPQEIKLRRTGTGPVELNINPARYWLLNDHHYPFMAGPFINPQGRFIINDSSQNISLKYSPPLSYNWLRVKLNGN